MRQQKEKATTSHDTSADDTSNISNDLDNIVSDLDVLSNKVDSGQQKDATTSNESSSSESNTSENTTDEVTKEESTTEESSKEAPTTEDPSNQPTSSKSETSIVDKLDSIKMISIVLKRHGKFKTIQTNYQVMTIILKRRQLNHLALKKRQQQKTQHILIQTIMY